MSFTDLSVALRHTAQTFLGEKLALYAWLNSHANTMFPPSEFGTTVTSSELDHFLDLHASSIPPSSILNLARALNAQGQKVENLTDFTTTTLRLQGAQSGSAALLFTYLASNTHRLHAKSCVIRDSDLTAWIAAATSGAATLLILQRMEKELLLAHYTLEAQMSNNHLTASQRRHWRSRMLCSFVIR
jgi:hypothetical protein